MLRITLEQWRMFHAVVEYGGFNQASQGVHKSQSSIHNAVGKVEESLGIKLFSIEGRKTVLTEAGQLMLRRSNYLLEEAQKIEAVGLTLRKGIESKLKIAVDEIFPRSLLYQVLENVSLAFPLLQIELIESILSGSSELLADENVEIAISPISLGSGFSESLCYIPFTAVASPNHSLHKLERELTLEDLKCYRQIVVRDSSRTNNETKASEGWLEANQRWTVSHMQSSIDMLCKGLGFAWVPINLIESELDNGLLKPLALKDNTKRSTQLYLTFKDVDRLGPAARSFLAEVRLLCMKLLNP
jgi:DNA-binding transcriptional LysR family regulator